MWGAALKQVKGESYDHSNPSNLGKELSKNCSIDPRYQRTLADWNIIFHIGSIDICEYHQFQDQLQQAIGLSNPVYQVEPSEVKLYQAVLPNRKEIPESMQITIEDIIGDLARKHNVRKKELTD